MPLLCPFESEVKQMKQMVKELASGYTTSKWRSQDSNAQYCTTEPIFKKEFS